MDFLNALQNSLQFSTLLILVFGTILGIICGAIPGINVTMAVALVLPATFMFPADVGFAMLLTVYVGAMYGSAIPSVLVNIPGTPSSMMTAIDGYPLAKQGKAGMTLGVAAFGSFFGGIFAGFVLIFLAPVLGRVALRFGPAEFFAIGVFALSLIASMSSSENIFKGLIAGLLGVLVGSVGIDPLTGATRYTFGSVFMAGGLQLVPLLVGFFGFREVLNQICESRGKLELIEQVTKIIPPLKIFKRISFTLIRSAVIGTYVGILPGAGAPIASFLAYDTEQKIIGKKSDTFGKGEICGVAAPETANNAANGGALIPTLTLGVPGDGATAVMLGAFMMHNITPGPTLFTRHPDLVNSIYANYMIACVLMLILGLAGIRLFMQTVKVPQTILIPIVSVICVVGAYSIRNNMFDVGVMLAAGIVAFILQHRNFPIMALVLGTILSGMIELQLRAALQIDSTGRIFFQNPISFGLLCAAALFFIRPFWKQYIKGIFMRSSAKK